MNERIKELLNEATVGLEPDLSPQRTVTLNELEKFAELIVRECAKRVDYWESRQGEHTDDILKHFGVEYENIKAGAVIHAGDGGYEIGTQEAYNEFIKKRNEK